MIHVVEQVELLRALPTGKQLTYRSFLVLGLTLMLLVCITVAITLTLLLMRLVYQAPLDLQQIVTVGFPVAVAFVATIGVSGSQAIPGQPVRLIALHTARRGLLNGLLCGLVFGVLWYFLLGFGAFAREDWAFLFRPQLLVYGLIFGLAIAPAFAIFKAFATVLPDMLLVWLSTRN